ncbi:MAG: enoyl-CoA hydratase-related protein [bacterium]
MSYQDIIFEKSEGKARIIINRADKMNSFREQTLSEMHEAVEDAASDASVGVVVICGAGGRAFCSGGDVSEMGQLDRAGGRDFLYRFMGFLQSLRRCPHPVIAAVDGYCLGGGNEINMCCDLTLATEKSRFGQVGPTVGSIPVLAGTQYLPRSVGDKKAKEIIFLCQRYSASEACDMGWINKVVEDGKLEEELEAWCDRILSMSPQSLRIAKQSLNFEADLLTPSFTHGIELLSMTYGSEELKEGMNAFLEKRKPAFMKFRK